MTQPEEAPNTKHCQGWRFIYQGLPKVINNRVTLSSILKGFKNSKCNLLKSWDTGSWYRDTAQTKPAAPAAGEFLSFRIIQANGTCTGWTTARGSLTVEELSLDNYASYRFFLLLLPFLHSLIFIDRCKTTSEINDQLLDVKICPPPLSQN